MFKKLLSFLFICILIVNVKSEIIITSLKTDPETNPTAVESNGMRICAGINVTVGFSETPSGKIIAKSTYNIGTITAEQDKITPTSYVFSGIELKDGDSLAGFEVSIDGNSVSFAEDVKASTLTCDPGVIGSSSAETSTLPKITSFTIQKSSAVSTMQKGMKYCTNVLIDFTMDQILKDVENLEPHYKSFPVLGQKTTYVNITNNGNDAVYHFLLDVSEGGNLDDLEISYKDNTLTGNNKISFTCKSSDDSSNNIEGDPTTVQTITTPTSTGQATSGFCSLSIEFTLDKIPTNNSDLTITSTSISGTPTITQKESTNTYTATFNVKEGGDLSDLKINYKGTSIATSTINYTCNKVNVIDGDDSDSDGSTGFSISSNLISTIFLTSLLLLISN